MTWVLAQFIQFVTLKLKFSAQGILIWKSSQITIMGKDQELLDAARNGCYAAVEKILLQRTKRSGPLAR